jgi:acetyl-CoA synthetase
MVHTTAGYMVYTVILLKNFNYEENDIFGVRLILDYRSFLYSVWPLIERSNNSDFLGYLRILILVVFGIEKHKVTQFYTAPTAIRALAKENVKYVQKHHLKFKVIGSVGEPINEAWHWYNDHVGQKMSGC